VTLALPERHLVAIRRHGEADYPHEACGLMAGVLDGDQSVVARLVPLTNQRTDSARNRYLIDPGEYLRAERELRAAGMEILGVYHSHPDHPAMPSTTDREQAWPRWSYVIVSVAAGKAAEIRSWRLTEDRSAFQEESITQEEGKVAWQ
jgi:proteasome lid subunit RPN8/RPN11